MFTFFGSYLPFRPLEGEGGGAGGGTGAPSTPAPASASVSASTPVPATPGGTPASPTGIPTGQQTPPDDLQDGNWRELRTRYESQKQQLAQLQAQSTATSQIVTSAQGMARQLGYTDQDFAEAFQSNPLRTLEILQSEMNERQNQQQPPQGDGDLSRQIDEAVSARLTPIQQFQNTQATEVAMAKYEGVLQDNIKADPILKDAPDEVISIVKDYLGEYFSTQTNVLLAMKQKGDFSAVPDAVKFVAGRLHSAFRSWLAKSGGGPAPSPTGQGGPNGRGRPTLDQIIDDPGILGPQYKQ